MPRSRPRRPRLRVWMTAAAAATIVLATTTSCVLSESDSYVIQDAPPNGIHVTLRHRPSMLLVALSYLVKTGKDADTPLRAQGFDLRCNHYAHTWENGDRCAFRALQAVRVSGGLTRTLGGRRWWSAAVADGELGDFRSSTMIELRRASTRCAHVTIRDLGTRPVPTFDANWTTRTASDRHC